MLTDKSKRCRYCGGTLWLDGGVVKCFMCSRPLESQNAMDRAIATFSHPKLPGTYGKTGLGRAK